MKIFFNHDSGHTIDDRVFCETFCYPEDESNDFLLSNGWCPSMEEQSVWYQTRSCRMDTEKLDLSNRRKNFLGKLQFEVEDYKSDFYIDEFFSKFYKRKKYDIFDLYQNCSNFFDIKVMKILYKGDFVACARFIENEHSNLFINSAFSENHTKLSLGINLFYILIEYTKSQDKKYLYIYESYPNNYSYKSTLSGVEIWNGKKWV